MFNPNQKKVTTNIVNKLPPHTNQKQLNTDRVNVAPVPASNIPYNTINEGDELANKRSDILRPDVTRRDTDTFPNINIGLEDIDKAIFNHIKDNLNIIVVSAGEQIRVPIVFGDPERWSAVQKDGFIRDKDNKILYPLIMLKRNGFTRNDKLMTLNRYLKEIVCIKRNPKINKYDLFNIVDNKNLISSKNENGAPEIYTVTLPDHILVNYEITVWTNFIEQMNTIIERINFAAEEYWGDRNRLIFRVRISDYANTNEIQSGDDRLIKSTFNLEVWGYLLPKNFENYRSTTTRNFGIAKISLGVDVGLNSRDMMQIATSKTNELINNIITPKQNATPNNVKLTTFKFLSYEKTVYGSFVNNDGNITSIKFENTQLLPTPKYLIRSINEIDKFNIFINGTILNKLVISSFEQISTDFVVYLNNLLLPIVIDTTTRIESTGKFE